MQLTHKHQTAHMLLLLLLNIKTFAFYSDFQEEYYKHFASNHRKFLFQNIFYLLFIYDMVFSCNDLYIKQ